MLVFGRDGSSAIKFNYYYFSRPDTASPRTYQHLLEPESKPGVLIGFWLIIQGCLAGCPYIPESLLQSQNPKMTVEKS